MYYPKSQIKPNLYTSGGTYKNTSTQEIYTGYYYETSSGEKFTGKSPQDGPNTLLIEIDLIQTQPLSSDFASLITTLTQDPSYKSTTPIERVIPTYNITIPTTKDYELGIFQRYFCKRNNELAYIEINKDTYQQLNLKDPKIAWDLYSAQSLLWQITGMKEQTYNANKSNVNLIETQQKWHGFSQYFKDKYLKYYLES